MHTCEYWSDYVRSVLLSWVGRPWGNVLQVLLLSDRINL